MATKTLNVKQAASADTVAICSRLPFGVELRNPINPDRPTVTVYGLNASNVIGADHYVTHVDREFWSAWLAKNADFAPLKNGAIFEADNAADADVMAAELQGELTGLDPIQPDAMGVTAADGKA